MFLVLDDVKDYLPPKKPHYLMGVGTPSDILGAVKRGIDMFDCVLPTRSGRTGLAFTWQGKVNIKNKKYQNDDTPLDINCTNLEEIELQEDVSYGYLRIKNSIRKEDTNLALTSFYRKRIREKTRLSPQFIRLFLESSKEYQLASKIKTKNQQVNLSILQETSINNLDNTYELKKDQSLLDLENADDLQKAFDTFTKQNLDPFYPEERSIKRLNQAIYKFFELEFNIHYEKYLRSIINIVLSSYNHIHFKNVIYSSKQKYLKIVEKTKDSLIKIEDWNIPYEISYYAQVKEWPIKKSIMQPFFISKLINDLKDQNGK